MVGARNTKPTGVQAPPPPAQAARQPMKAAGVAGPAIAQPAHKEGGYQGAPRTAAATQHSTEVLHQRSKMPFCPARLALGGFALAVGIGYLTLYSKKKPEATALDVAKVVGGGAESSKGK